MAIALLLGLGGCSSDSSNSTTQPSTLEAPSVQSYTGDTYNVLDWPAVEDATGYTIYVTTDGSDPTPTAEHLLETVDAPPYLHGDFQKDGVWVTGDEPLQAGQTYRYIVTAQFGGIEGPCSNCVTCVLEVPGSGTWRVEGLGNNLV